MMTTIHVQHKDRHEQNKVVNVCNTSSSLNEPSEKVNQQEESKEKLLLLFQCIRDIENADSLIDNDIFTKKYKIEKIEFYNLWKIIQIKQAVCNSRYKDIVKLFLSENMKSFILTLANHHFFTNDLYERYTLYLEEILQALFLSKSTENNVYQQMKDFLDEMIKKGNNKIQKLKLLNMIWLIVNIRYVEDRKTNEHNIRSLYIECINNRKLNKITISIIKRHLNNQSIKSSQRHLFQQITSNLKNIYQQQFPNEKRQQIKESIEAKKEDRSKQQEPVMKSSYTIVQQTKDSISKEETSYIEIIPEETSIEHKISKYMDWILQNRYPKEKLINKIKEILSEIDEKQFTFKDMNKLIQCAIICPQIASSIFQICFYYREIKDVIIMINDVLAQKSLEMKQGLKQWMTKNRSKRNIFLLKHMKF